MGARNPALEPSLVRPTACTYRKLELEPEAETEPQHADVEYGCLNH